MTVEFDFYLKMSPTSQTLKFGSHTDTKQSIYLSDVILGLAVVEILPQVVQAFGNA